MNKAVGISIGVAAVVIAFVIAGGSTMLNDQGGLPSDDQNEMAIGDKVSVTVQPAEENTEVETKEVEEESTEGKSLEVNIIDGISATSEP